MRFYLFRMIKPFDFDHHVAVPRFPEKLNLADVRPINTGGGKKDGAVANVDNLSTSFDGAVEELFGLAFTAGTSIAFVVPVPKWSSRHRIDAFDVWLLWFSDLERKR
jgi:hypothetical protein